MSKAFNPLVKVRRTITGLGLVAATAIPRGTKIIQYIGPIISAAEADKMAGRYLFSLSTRRCINGSDRKNIARYLNHACNPNAEAIATRYEIWIYAIKNIQRGEEITIDYGEDYFNEFIKPKGCRCASCQ
jgi:uncharacterized protein